MIHACIASIPEREQMLRKTVASLRGQVDEIYIALNGYGHMPGYLSDCNVIELDNSMGDAGKFYFVENLKGNIFTCDDDLIYPPDYVKYMLMGIARHHCAVTLHGKTYPRPVTTFKEVLHNYRCLDDVDSDGRVDVGGTGVMAWNSKHLKVKYSDFGSANMADLWFAKLCWEQGVKIMCLEHKKNNLGYQRPETTIWDTEKKKGFKEQTELLKSFLK